LTSIVGIKILWKSMAAVNCLLNSFFVFNKRKKFIQVWNNVRVSKYDKMYNFG